MCLVQRPDVHHSPKFLRRLVKPDLIFIVRACLWQAVVVRGCPSVKISQLDPASWAEVLVGLPEEGRPIGYTATHGTHLDEIEGPGP